MEEKLNYISDEELERLICRVEQKELVAAPPDLMESILTAAKVNKQVKSVALRKKEFYAYCFRVITSVAAAVALVFLLPQLSGYLEPMTHKPGQYETVSREDVVAATPAREDVILNTDTPTKAEVVASKPQPSKEEVLNKTGFFERVISNTGWFNRDSNDK